MQIATDLFQTAARGTAGTNERAVLAAKRQRRKGQWWWWWSTDLTEVLDDPGRVRGVAALVGRGGVRAGVRAGVAAVARLDDVDGALGARERDAVGLAAADGLGRPHVGLDMLAHHDRAAVLARWRGRGPEDLELADRDHRVLVVADKRRVVPSVVVDRHVPALGRQVMQQVQL